MSAETRSIVLVPPRHAMTLTVELMRSVRDRIYAAAGAKPHELLVHPNTYYDILVHLRDPRWLAMPFRICPWETRGQTEERWRRRRAFTGAR